MSRRGVSGGGSGARRPRPANGPDRDRKPAAGAPAWDAVTRQEIRLTDLTVACRIGVSEAERAERQALRINIRLEVRPEPPSQDRIAEVVDYGKLVARVRKACLEAEFRLVESLAQCIATACFFDPRVLVAAVRVEKLERYPDIAGIGCEIEFRRAGA